MKHLLIILISFLLLSSFVTSCDKKEETLYRWETSSGIVWKRFGDKDTHRVYKGEWKNGEKWRPNGLGVMTYPNGEKYVGEFRDGYINGQGTYTWSDGDMYEGEFKDGKRHGQGTYTWSGGNKYEGEYKDGEIDGKGTQTFSDGRKWTGEFRKNKRWNTTIYNKNGNIIGKFVNGIEYDKYGNFQGKWVNGVQQ